MAPVRSLFAIVASLAATAPAIAFEQRELGAGHLPPITQGYQAQIVRWSGRFFADRNAALAGSSLSAPVLIRDGTGRLLWLVCLQAPNAGPDPDTGGYQRHAFGFAPNYFTAPQERRRATLTRDYCDERPLAWRPFGASARFARHH